MEIATGSFAQKNVSLIPVGEGWANNSVNTVVFRKNSIVSDEDTQYIAYYDADQFVMLGKRNIKSKRWEIKRTDLKGNISDAHKSISIMIDGDGYLHVAWDHHNNPLNYCRSVSPGSLELTAKLSMTGMNEKRVTYPEFYRLANGDLLFFFRDGASGNGNLVINQYDIHAKKWRQLQNNLIDGEGRRNAYWQACVDPKGAIHLSWVWRESPDVASNHDLCYARSKDGGKTWEKSNGEKYQLPITAASAEYAFRIPQKSELINQTSMSTDDGGNPYIATYWRNEHSTVPQFHLVYFTGKGWKELSFNFHKTAFSLSGMGSKRIPVSRPQVIVKGTGENASAIMIFRDEERQNKVSAATIDNIKKNKWSIHDLTSTSVGSWEPTYDTELWRRKHLLHLFVQKVEQIDGEGVANVPPQMVYVLEWH